MDKDRRNSRRIKNKVSVFYKRVSDDSELSNAKEEIYHTVDSADSFSFFTSLQGLDSSFNNLNKAFVVMMKQMDAKLNYLIDIIRNGGRDSELEGFRMTYSCDISGDGVSFFSEDLRIGDAVFIKFFLPIASHVGVKILGKVVGESYKRSKRCVNVEFLEITNQHRELIIHYMIFVERKMARDRLNE